MERPGFKLRASPIDGCAFRVACRAVAAPWVAAVVMLASLPVAVSGGGAGSGADILCASSPDEAARPRSIVATLRSEPLVGAPGKWITVQLIRYPARARTPAHVHGGDVTAYVVEGVVRSEHAGLAAADYAAGATFHEPLGTTHVFIENPSFDQPAAILAVMIHDEGAALTTFLP